MTTRFFLDGEAVRTVDEWRWEKGYARPGSCVWTTLANYAKRHGTAIAMRCDDAAVEFTRDESGKVHRHTHRPGTVAWDWPGRGA